MARGPLWFQPRFSRWRLPARPRLRPPASGCKTDPSLSVADAHRSTSGPDRDPKTATFSGIKAQLSRRFVDARNANRFTRLMWPATSCRRRRRGFLDCDFGHLQYEIATAADDLRALRLRRRRDGDRRRMSILRQCARRTQRRRLLIDVGANVPFMPLPRAGGAWPKAGHKFFRDDTLPDGTRRNEIEILGIAQVP